MIRVVANRKRISIIADLGSALLAGSHRAYFEAILDFRRSSSGMGYEWDEGDRVGEQVREVCDYLEKHSLAYEVDPEAERMLSRSRGSEVRLADAIAAGREVKENAEIEEPTIFGLKRCLLPHQWVPNISPEAERRIILTGTPMPNGFMDLWTQATFLWPDQLVFGNRIQFKSKVSTPAGQQIARDRMSPLFTRVRKSDLGLPDQLYERVKVSMAPIQSRIYAALTARTLQDIALLPTERMVIREWRRAKMIRLLQAASNPALLAQNSIEFSIPPESALDRPLLELIGHYLRFEMPPKVLAADQLVRNIFSKNPTEKIVIWTHFVRNIKLLLDLLSSFGALPLYGAVPREAADDDEESFTRESHIRAFRHDSACRVLVANPGAAAESISLHKVCHHAIYLDRTFNAGQFIQSRDRIHRVGLSANEDVTYHLLMTEGSIDEIVDQRLLAKETAMMNLLNDPDLPTAGFEISTDHLSGPDEEEEIDFDAVIEDIRRRLEQRGPLAR